MPPRTKGAGKAKTREKVHPIKKPIRPDNYTPRVIVKFYNDVDLPEDNATLQQLLEQGKLGPWGRLKDKGIKIQRLITKCSRQSFSDLLTKAQQLDPTFHPHRFDTYFAVTLPQGTNASEVRRAFDSWQTIEDAYIESGPTKPPQVNRMGSRFGSDQKYLDPAPSGIDAECAWTIPGGDGAGVDLQFLDVEHGWIIQPRFPYDHQDLPQGISLASGYNYDWFGHGTAVLSTVVGRDNGMGCVGITPKLQNVQVASLISDSDGTLDRYNAINEAMQALNFGDVLLIEDQIDVEGYSPSYGEGLHGNLPVELDNSLFKLIQEATSNVKGITIIEAAGNGALDLDSFEPSTSLFWGQEDSGAVIVAAANVPQSRRVSSYNPLTNGTNSGSRVDCFSWGEQIPAAGDGNNGRVNGPQDYSNFGGTSGAAAIIAGAALALQGIAQTKNLRPANPKGRFSPSELRDLLRNPSTGTPSKNPTSDNIGVMPDLRKILRSLGFPV